MVQKDTTTIIDFSDYIGDRTRDFTGREWVFAEIEGWLARPDAPRFFIITGEPGIGKTAIAARVTQVYDLATFSGDSGMTACSVAGDGVIIVAGETSGRVHILRLEGVDMV